MKKNSFDVILAIVKLYLIDVFASTYKIQTKSNNRDKGSIENYINFAAVLPI